MSEPRDEEQPAEGATQRLPVLDQQQTGNGDEADRSEAQDASEPPPAPEDEGEPEARFWSARRVPAGIVALLLLGLTGLFLYDIVSVRAGRPGMYWRRELAEQLAERPLDDTWVLVGAGVTAVLGLWLLILAATPGLRDVLPMRRRHAGVRAGLHRDAAATALRDRAMEVAGVQAARVRVAPQAGGRPRRVAPSVNWTTYTPSWTTCSPTRSADWGCPGRPRCRCVSGGPGGRGDNGARHRQPCVPRPGGPGPAGAGRLRAGRRPRRPGALVVDPRQQARRAAEQRRAHPLARRRLVVAGRHRRPRGAAAARPVVARRGAAADAAWAEVLVDTGDGEGALLRGRALENVLTQEAAHIDGVGGAHAHLKGRRSAPEAHVRLALEPHVDPGTALTDFTTGPLTHARTSAGLASLPAEVRLKGVKHGAERVS